jgi:hypothetical protein
MEGELKSREASYRQGRQKTREVVSDCDKRHTDLSSVIAENGELVKANKRGTAKLDVARKDGLSWQGKYDKQRDVMIDREERLTLLECSVVSQNRSITALGMQVAYLTLSLQARDEEVSSTHGELWRQVCLPFFYLLFLSSN